LACGGAKIFVEKEWPFFTGAWTFKAEIKYIEKVSLASNGKWR
jgi:hypothetical protein